MNLKEPHVTIISIYHNRENYVVESIESLLNQKYANFTVYVIDDNSSDNTLNRLKELEVDHTHLKIIHNEKNKGFTNSLVDTISTIDSTDYIAIHGSGDISLPDRIVTQVNFLKENTDVGVVAVGVTNRPANNISKSVRELKLNDFLNRNLINHGTVMFRHDIYEKVGGYRRYFRTRQDKDLWFRMCLETRLFFLPDKLYTWVKQESSVSSNSFKNPEPFFLSEFAKFLILQRKSLGYDFLDVNERYATLSFDPRNCLGQLYNVLILNLAKRQWSNSVEITNVILVIKSSSITRFPFLLLRKVLMKIQK
ncbi:glycosyltransferase [Sphingobacterium alkalisoli]|uniref:Glycosyltransferase n=1 Tax=Sphingobacterium alkalisoli TaxID=1874115 RepID=A0A4U0GN65_9SPHI|nr:glycosyltransferase [Sphingobacterium alkalisoli]TJY60167.1 glycosyltransferase [Sphingobacterium alkalisoli]GGH32330.1 hypothetical protein GCM10011418_45790 [Sphingobacterium alkalisoli]